MHDRLIASAGRTLPRTRARAGRLLLALGLVVPPQEGAARLARFEAQIAVLVRQVGQYTQADDSRKRVSGKVERLQGVECKDESGDVCRWHRLLGRLSVNHAREEGGKSHWFGGRWNRYDWRPDDSVRLSRKDGTYPIKQSGCETVSIPYHLKYVRLTLHALQQQRHLLHNYREGSSNILIKCPRE